MLCLTRKEGESIVVDENIEVLVLDITRGRVRLGISAPKEKRIDRKEVRGGMCHQQGCTVKVADGVPYCPSHV